jgi:hypothetical protein
MSIKYRFVIFTQNWTGKSNGVSVLYNLSTEIENCGYECGLYIFDAVDICKNAPENYKKRVTKKIDFSDEGLIVILPDSLPHHLSKEINAKHRVWYFLNKAMVLTGEPLQIMENDVTVSYSKLIYVDDFQLFYNTRVPEFEEIAYKIQKKEIKKRNQIVVYYGKARKKFRIKTLLLKIKLGTKVIPITRSIPKSKRDLLKLLSESRMLVTFDPLTNLSYEATLCRTPVFVADNYTGTDFNNYNIPLPGFFTEMNDLCNIYLSGINDESYNKIWNTYFDSQKNHHETTQRFLDYVINKFNKKEATQTNSFDSKRSDAYHDEYLKLKNSRQLINHKLNEYHPVYSIAVSLKLLHLYLFSRVINILIFISCTLVATNKSLRGKIRKVIRDKKFEILSDYSLSLRNYE